jgi:hypothetical protein
MELENETLEQLFERWNKLMQTKPSDDDIKVLKNIIEYTSNDPDYLAEKDETDYFQKWCIQLPPYYQEKAKVMLQILSRLRAENPYTRIVSEVIGEKPQLAKFLFVRYLEVFALKDPLWLHSKGTKSNKKPKWLWDLMQKGVSIEEIDNLAKQVASYTIWAILGVTDGYGAYGDLPPNAPRPRIIESYIEDEQKLRYLMGIHELIENSVLLAEEPPPPNEES